MPTLTTTHPAEIDVSHRALMRAKAAAEAALAVAKLEWRPSTEAEPAHLAPHLAIPPRPLPRATAQALAEPRQPGIASDVVQQMLEALRAFDAQLTAHCPGGPDGALAPATDLGPVTLANWRALRAAIAAGEGAL